MLFEDDAQDEAEDSDDVSVCSSEWSVIDEADPTIEDLPTDAQVCYDLYRNSRNSAKDLKAQAAYVKERKDLQGTCVPVSSDKGKSVVNWVVSDDEDYEFFTNPVSDNEIGLKGVDFQSYDATDPSGRQSRVNLLRPFFALWPGNLRRQLQQLNSRIERDNGSRQRNKVGLLSLREMIQFLAVLLIASLEGKKGSDLWQGSEAEGEGYRSQIDVSRHMTNYRHRQIRKYFPYLFANEDKKQTDPWWQVSQGIEDFNLTCKKAVKPGLKMVLDESMSAFRPRTTATGNLPNLSYIQRKPEPLGTELKVTADAHTGMFLFLEIQRGKEAMRRAEFAQETLKTTACTARLMKYTAQTWDNEKRSQPWDRTTYYGDAWFGSVPSVVAAVQNNCNLVCIVKNAHRQYPKKFLEQTMADWPPGSNLSLKATIHGVKLTALGYKYSKNKVLCFLHNKGAGTMNPGRPYVAKWKDIGMEIPRPSLCPVLMSSANTLLTQMSLTLTTN